MKTIMNLVLISAALLTLPGCCGKKCRNTSATTQYEVEVESESKDKKELAN